MFAKWFNQFSEHLEAAKIQSFVWSQLTYSLGKGKSKTEITLRLDEYTYLILLLRYKELLGDSSGDGGPFDAPPFDIEGHLTAIDTGVIDAEYMNARFEKFLKTLQQEGAKGEQTKQALDELHKSFASLSQEEQKYAQLFLNDVERGDVKLEDGKTFRDYITNYQTGAKDTQVMTLVETFGLDKTKLVALMSSGVTKKNFNEFGRFDALKDTVDKEKAKAYFEKLEGESLSEFKVNMKVDKLLQDFVVSGGSDL